MTSPWSKPLSWSSVVMAALANEIGGRPRVSGCPRPASWVPRPSSWEEPFARSGLLTTPRTHWVPSCFRADSPTREAPLPPFERDPSPPSPPAPHPEAFHSPVRPQRALLPVTEFSSAHLCLRQSLEAEPVPGQRRGCVFPAEGATCTGEGVEVRTVPHVWGAIMGRR